MYTVTIPVPLSRAAWTDTGIILSAADSASIIVSGQGGISGGTGNEPRPAWGDGYWLCYPEGVYEGLNGGRSLTPYVNRDQDLGAVQRGYFGLDLWRYIAPNINAEMAVVGIILPEGQVPGFGWSAMPPETGTFYIGRGTELRGGEHASGRLWVISNDIANAFEDNYGTYQVQITLRQWEVDAPPLNVGMWNPKYLIFNDSIVQESAGSPRWANVRLASEISEVRRKFRSRPLWNLDLSGCLLSPDQYDELLAFQWENEGMAKEFLVRNSRQCHLENFAGRGSFLGLTNADSTIFQLRKERKIQGRTKYETIRFPKWFYPPLLDLHEREWLVLPDTSVWVGGTGEMDNRGICVSNDDRFEMDRDTGLFDIGRTDIPNGLPVWGFGGYFTRMICTEDEIPVKLQGTMFQISNGVKFCEVISSENDFEEGDESDGGASGNPGDDDNSGIS